MNEKEMVTVDVCELDMDSCVSIGELIQKLQDALEKVPAEHRHAATVRFAAYDWEGVFVEYDRPPSAEERAEAEAIFADRQALIERTDASDMAEWVRPIRLRYAPGPGNMGRSTLTADEAMGMIRNDECAVTSHPKYNFKSKLITA